MSVKEKIIHLVEAGICTQKAISRDAGFSEGALSAYLGGAYKGNNENIGNALLDYLIRREERQRRKQLSVDFVKTRLSAGMLGLIRNTHLDCDIGVIYGPAGSGKTMALRHYAATHGGVILIEADPGYTAKVLLSVLCDALKVEDKARNISGMVTQCINALEDKKWIILVDEAELLPYRALEALRRIHDRSGVAVVLAGLPRLVVNLTGSRGEYAQLYSRVGMAMEVSIKPVRRRDEREDDYSLRLDERRQDFLALLAPLLPKGVTDDAAIVDAFWDKAGGNYRRMFKLARGVTRMAEVSGAKIDVAAIEHFSKMLINNSI